jgi:hypothetical protein
MGGQKHDTAPKNSERFALDAQLGVWLWRVYRGEFSKFSKLLQTLGPPSLLVGQARGLFFDPLIAFLGPPAPGNTALARQHALPQWAHAHQLTGVLDHNWRSKS